MDCSWSVNEKGASRRGTRAIKGYASTRKNSLPIAEKNRPIGKKRMSSGLKTHRHQEGGGIQETGTS